jgi:hypothetical protein
VGTHGQGTTMDTSTKTRVFTYAFSGLSAKVEIVSHLSWLVLDQLKDMAGVNTTTELL